jgi:hypothetical protein
MSSPIRSVFSHIPTFGNDKDTELIPSTWPTLSCGLTLPTNIQHKHFEVLVVMNVDTVCVCVGAYDGSVCGSPSY